MATPFVQDTRLTAIAVGFKNEAFIADQIAPRIVVPTEEFRWTEYNSDEAFSIPNTLVGRKGVPNEVEFTAKEHNDAVVDYGLSAPVPQSDILKAQNHPAFDPEGRATMKTRELVALDREKRVADFVGTPGNYNHSQALTAGSKFTDYDSDQFEISGTALETPRVRPNTMVLGHTEWFHLRRNQNILKAIGRNVDMATGMATRAEVAELFELTGGIIVGESRYNTANRGQSPTITRLWGGVSGLLYIKPAAQLEEDITFMLTASYLGPVSYRKQLEPGEMGLRGGVKITVGDSMKEVQISKEAGFLFTGAV